jgi:hypothetical protein
LPNPRQELGIVHRFLEKSLCSRLDGALSIYTNVASGDDDDGDHGERGNFLSLSITTSPSPRRQTKVEDNQIRLVLSRLSQDNPSKPDLMLGTTVQKICLAEHLAVQISG